MSFCPECGTRAEANVQFCGSCGSSIHGGASKPAPVSTQPPAQQPPQQGYQQPPPQQPVIIVQQQQQQQQGGFAAAPRFLAPRKDPTLATVLTLFIPGFAHFYNNRVAEGVIYFILTGLLWIIFVGGLLHIYLIITAAGMTRETNIRNGYIN